MSFGVSLGFPLQPTSGTLKDRPMGQVGNQHEGEFPPTPEIGSSSALWFGLYMCHVSKSSEVAQLRISCTYETQEALPNSSGYVSNGATAQMFFSGILIKTTLTSGTEPQKQLEPKHCKFILPKFKQNPQNPN